MKQTMSIAFTVTLIYIYAHSRGMGVNSQNTLQGWESTFHPFCPVWPLLT